MLVLWKRFDAPYNLLSIIYSNAIRYERTIHTHTHTYHCLSMSSSYVFRCRRVLSSRALLSDMCVCVCVLCVQPNFLQVGEGVQYKGLVDALVTPVIEGVKGVFSMIVSGTT